jgi:Fe-S oxidoreductase
MTEFLFQLINEGRLEITEEFAKKITYHDPCYLGRHNGIYNEPRETLKKIPGLNLIEMEDSFENSLCCGGGGGRVWMETLKEERFSNIRIEQAVCSGADILVTACPYCIAMFEDSRVVMNYEDKIEVKDITEIIADVIC